MKTIKIFNIATIFILLITSSNCTEPIEITDQLIFEDAIVIEATITNEFKLQKIFISRTFQFEDDGPKPEINASVSIVDDANNIYVFKQDEPGIYLSEIKFRANPKLDYQLFVSTSDNREYLSNKKQLTNSTQIDKLYASREVNSVGTEVISILVDSFDPSQNSNYYRYEYEETYKIIAPFWTAVDAFVIELDPPLLPTVGTRRRTQEEKICYNTVYSKNIIQTKTTDLLEDRISNFSVRNISVNDAIISHRYSILVKQYVQSLEAFTYYDILNKLSSSDNLFSQIQPGFISSNILSKNSTNDKVLGFFEISSVSEKRIFFNYEDLFPGEPLPPYFIDCPILSPPLVGVTGLCLASLVDAIIRNDVKFFDFNTEPPPQCEGPYFMVWRACGDCTALGSNLKPDFWIE